MVFSDWPAGSPRILVADAWLANSGDAAIALETVSRLRRLAPAAAILVAGYQGDRVAAEYPDLDLVPPLAALLGLMPGELERRGWPLQRAERLLECTDGVLSQGGGFLHEVYAPVARLTSYPEVLDRGIPLAFCAQSVGVFDDPASRHMLWTALRGATAIGVRDHASLKAIRELSGRDDVVLGADEVFSTFATAPAPLPGRGVGVVLTRHPRTTADGVPLVADAGALAAALANVAAAADPQPLILFSTTQGLGAASDALEDDGEFMESVWRELPDGVGAAVRLEPGYLSSHRCVDLIRGLRALVSMRMHPVIMGTALGVPSLLVGAVAKAADFGALGMGDAVIDAELGDAVTLRWVVEATGGTAVRGGDLWRRLAPARHRAALNDVVVTRLLEAAELRAAAMSASLRPSTRVAGG